MSNPPNDPYRSDDPFRSDRPDDQFRPAGDQPGLGQQPYVGQDPFGGQGTYGQAPTYGQDQPLAGQGSAFGQAPSFGQDPSFGQESFGQDAYSGQAPAFGAGADASYGTGAGGQLGGDAPRRDADQWAHDNDRSLTDKAAAAAAPVKDQAVDSAKAVKDQAVDSATTVKDQAVGAAATVKDQAVSGAVEVRDSATQHAQDLAGHAQSEARRVGHEARSQISSLVGQTTDQLSQHASEQKGRLAETISGWTDELDSIQRGESTGGPVQALLGDLTQTAKSANQWLEQREPGDIANEVRRFAARRPTTFLLAAAGLGLVAARLGRALVDEARDDTPSTPSSSGAQSRSQLTTTGGFTSGSGQSIPSYSSGAGTVPAHQTGAPTGFGTADQTGSGPQFGAPGFGRGNDAGGHR